MATRRSELTQARAARAAGFVTLAEKLDEKSLARQGAGLVGWMVSEKFDGLRGLWDPRVQAFRSRSQEIFPIPADVGTELAKVFGDLQVDGEIWAGRNKLRIASSLGRGSKTTSREWRDGLRVILFDIKNAKGPYIDRYRLLLKKLKGVSPLVKIAKQIEIEEPSEIKKLFDDIGREGGEGIIVRDPTAPYILGRTSRMLKMKHVSDLDAIIVGSEHGEGRNRSRIGAYFARKVDRKGHATGPTFKVGTGLTDEDRENPLPIGTIIIVEYDGLTHTGKPRDPRFKGSRGTRGRIV